MASNSDLPLITKFKLHVLRLSRRVYTRSDGTINRRLFSLIDIKASAPATKLIDKTAISTTDIPIDPSRNLWFRLFTPTTYGPDTKSFDDLCSHLATKVPAVIASVNYRLTPEHKYPTQYDDSFDALKFIDAQNYAVLPANTDLSRCFIGGDSAGGNIAHHVTIRAFQKTNHFEKIKIIGILSVQPFFGGEERTESEVRLASAPVIDVKMTDLLWRNFLPEGSDRNHPAANVFGGTELSAEDAAALENLEFPNVLVIVGGNDPLQDWQRRYVNGLKNCGKQVELIEYSNAFHGFYSFQELPEFALLIEDVTNFIRKLAHSE
ncbi:hypothetical protein MIMGU_mgv1a018055mg [Erythranthe guttata]|uniref:Alpha/beta hydrolase fold-3 domain-containing protein n=1 Tax=Erythranthe guttata TaxID=4155 RepID=A0A022Q157_ERYGU|nr:hypothetical protein MIMGU_mgv1a018055mg [Erythranthe guttata]